jgi:carboxypeptidase Taq
MNAYDELMGKIKEVVLLGTSVGMIYWDLETYMPPAGIQLRSEQISVLSKIGHEKSTTPEIGKLLEAADTLGADWSSYKTTSYSH